MYCIYHHKSMYFSLQVKIKHITDNTGVSWVYWTYINIFLIIIEFFIGLWISLTTIFWTEERLMLILAATQFPPSALQLILLTLWPMRIQYMYVMVLLINTGILNLLLCSVFSGGWNRSVEIGWWLISHLPLSNGSRRNPLLFTLRLGSLWGLDRGNRAASSVNSRLPLVKKIIVRCLEWNAYELQILKKLRESKKNF